MGFTRGTKHIAQRKSWTTVNSTSNVLDWKLSPNVECRVTLERLMNFHRGKKLRTNPETSVCMRTRRSCRGVDSADKSDNDNYYFKFKKVVFDIFEKCEDNCNLCEKYIQQLYNHLSQTHGRQSKILDHTILPNDNSNSNHRVTNLPIPIKRSNSKPSTSTSSLSNKKPNNKSKPAKMEIDEKIEKKFFYVTGSHIKQEQNEETNNNIIIGVGPTLPARFYSATKHTGEKLCEGVSTSTMNSSSPTNYKCVLCSKCYSTRGQLSRHIISHKGDQLSGKSTKKNSNETKCESVHPMCPVTVTRETEIPETRTFLEQPSPETTTNITTGISVGSDMVDGDNHAFNLNSIHKVPSASGTRRRPNWKRYKQYTKNDILDAIEAVKGGMSALQAARKYNVPSRTLYDRVKKMGMTPSRLLSNADVDSPTSTSTSASSPLQDPGQNQTDYSLGFHTEGNEFDQSMDISTDGMNLEEECSELLNTDGTGIQHEIVISSANW